MWFVGKGKGGGGRGMNTGLEGEEGRINDGIDHCSVELARLSEPNT